MEAIPAPIPTLTAPRTQLVPIPVPALSSSNKQLRLPGNLTRTSLAASIRRRPWPSEGRRSTVTCAAGVAEINESEFPSKVLESERPVLVEFVASWCGPCRLISPAMEWVAQEYSDRLTVVKIDHDANPQLIEEYRVYGLPTLIFFKNGQEVPDSRREGAITKVKLKEYVDALLESLSVA